MNNINKFKIQFNIYLLLYRYAHYQN